MNRKPPTPQGISALLRKAGFEKSVSRTTRIKGWHDWNEGFEVTGGSEVTVRHRLDKWARGEAADRRHAEQIAAYAAELTKAGYAVTTDDQWDRPRLIVTAGEG